MGASSTTLPHSSSSPSTPTASISAVDEPAPSSGIIPLPHVIKEENNTSNNSSPSSSSSPAVIVQKESIRNLLVKNVRFEHLAAGVSGGVVSTLVCHPLDLIKVRFQVYEGHSLSNPKVVRPEYRG